EVQCDLGGDETCWQLPPLGLVEGDGCLTRPEACSAPVVECGSLTDVYGEVADCEALVGKTCDAGWTCPEGANICECVPDCSGMECGVDHCDVPCGPLDGLCPGPQDICNGSQLCECVPLCTGKPCGQDGCGGLCPNQCGPSDVFLCDEANNVCMEIICSPGVVGCVPGAEQLQTCGDNGTFWIPGAACPDESICLEGECLGPCQQSTVKGSYIGCDFWAVDLDNIEESETAPVGLVVSVPATSGPTDVIITNTTTGQTLAPSQLGVGSNKVASGTVKVFTLPGGTDLDGSSLGPGSYHVATSYPTTVHQFNPLNGDGVYTNDASLLLPAEVTGERYFVMSWPHRQEEAFTLRGFATIVATQEGATHVLVAPTTAVTAGEGVETLEADASHSFTLQRGDVLNLETEGISGADLTGTYIEADKKVSVFGGHECANVPQGINACDHLEQQLLPLNT
ncbi:MAG: IgGFc-binding protein, partial [Myxococcota bacterium]|nr:IgGFc-binding protein [Myxococcota bacterium]